MEVWNFPQNYILLHDLIVCEHCGKLAVIVEKRKSCILPSPPFINVTTKRAIKFSQCKNVRAYPAICAIYFYYSFVTHYICLHFFVHCPFFAPILILLFSFVT